MNESRDWDRVFREDLAADAAVERGLMIKELFVIAIIALLVVLREALW